MLLGRLQPFDFSFVSHIYPLIGQVTRAFCPQQFHRTADTTGRQFTHPVRNLMSLSIETQRDRQLSTLRRQSPRLLQVSGSSAITVVGSLALDGPPLRVFCPPFKISVRCLLFLGRLNHQIKPDKSVAAAAKLTLNTLSNDYLKTCATISFTRSKNLRSIGLSKLFHATSHKLRISLV